jgi:hypothetical protein
MYSSTDSQLVHYMELSGQLRDLTALPAGNNCETHRIESRMAPENVWTFGKKSDLLSLPGFEHRIFQPVA